MAAKVSRKPDMRWFYERALKSAEREAFSEALAIKGIDEEIAALRVRLRATIEENHQDLALFLNGLDVLRRMVATKYGLSEKDQHAFESAFAAETLRRMEERGGENDDDPT